MSAAATSVQRDATLYLLGKGGAAIGIVVAIPLVTRGLGPREFADFALWSGVALWSATACVGWLQNGVGRLHRERRLRAGFSAYMAGVRGSLVLGALASAALVTTLAWASSDLARREIASFGLLAAATALFMGSQALAHADLEPRGVVTSDLVRGAALPIVLCAIALVGGLGIASAAIAHCVALLVAVVISRRRQRWQMSTPTLAELRPLLRYGLPIGLWLVVCLASAQLGRVALEWAGDPKALALYAGMQDVIVKGGTLLLMPVCSAIHARAMAWWAEGDHASIQHGLRRAFLIQAAVGGALVLGCAIFGSLLATILFGESAAPASTSIPLAVLLAVGVVATNIGLLAHKGLELGHATGTMLALACGALVTNVIACWLLVPVCGALGAALSFALSQIGYALAAAWSSRRRLTALGVRVPL